MINRSWKQFAFWLLTECLKVFTSPMSVYSGALDALKGWKYSRNATMFWIHLPAFVLLIAVYLAYAFSVFERTDSKVQRYSVEGEKLLPTRNLERLANTKFKFLDPNAVPITLEKAFSSDREKRFFTFAGLLGKRVLSFQQNNVAANYRMALMESIIGNDTEAKEKMFDLALGDRAHPPASSWAASWIIQAKEDKQTVDTTDLGKLLKSATSWSDCHIHLLSVYSQVLEQNGLVPAAIEIATEAAKRERAYNLPLARLHSRLKNVNELRDAAYAAEDFFGARLNTGNERDIDRVAVAEVRAMLGRYPQAVSVLEEGLRSKAARPELSKLLSNIRIEMFQQSIVTTGDNSTADMSLLESAIDADPSNPAISEMAANLLTRKIRPTRKIIDTLRKQIEAGITTAESHSALAQGFYLMGNEKEAIKNWEMAISKNPKNVQAHNNLAYCLSKSTPPNIERALELITVAANVEPNNADVLDTFGQILMIANRPKEAINKFEQSIGADGTKIATRRKLVEAYLAAGLKDIAKAQNEVIESMEDKSEKVQDSE